MLNFVALAIGMGAYVLADSLTKRGKKIHEEEKKDAHADTRPELFREERVSEATGDEIAPQGQVCDGIQPHEGNGLHEAG